MLTLTIVMMNNGKVFDIMVKPEQRIRDVLTVLLENGLVSNLHISNAVRARSWRWGTIVSGLLTFRQAGIFSGDILYIETEC